MNIWQELRNQIRNIRLLKSMNLVFNTVIVIIASTVIITSFIALLYLNVKKGFTDLALSTALMAITTIALAFLTYWNIHSRNTQEKRDRKERLLNEIIEWAEDAARLNFKIFNLIEAQISKESWVENVIGEIVSQFQVVEVKGDYINSIALSSFKGERKLSKAVKAVNKEIRELGDVSIKRLAKEVSSEVVKEHMDKLRLKIADLLKEVAEIKTRDIS